MSSAELQALKDELEFLVRNGRIRPSTSPYGAPVFYVKQKGKLRLVFDYRALNKNTVKSVAAIPNIQEMFDRLSNAKYFSKFDLASGYHQVLMAVEDIPKTAFRTKYGLFEWTVMPFGLSNAPATFQSMVNAIFSDMIDHFLIVYLDDILVFSTTLEEHVVHLDKVLQRLQDNKLHCRVTKCEFLKEELEYLGYRIKNNHVSVLPSRLQAIKDFEPPTSWTELRSFCGLANTIHRFVSKHAHILAPLTDLFQGLDRKNPPPFHFSPQNHEQFNKVKRQLSEPSTLALFDPTKPVHLYTDWSASAVGSYVCQPDNDGQEHPIAFASRKCNKAEQVYHPYMGEILALVEALRTHRHYIIGHHVKVFTDHRSLEHILSQPKLRPVQHRWLADLLSYDFEIQWHPGKWNTVADALSRRSHLTTTGTDPHIDLNNITEITDDLLDEIRKMTPDEPFFKEISPYLADPDDPANTHQEPDRHTPKYHRTKYSRYRLRNRLLYYVDKTHARLFVPGPLRYRVMSLAHDDGPAIHNNWERTAERITRFYHWPKLHKDVLNYVQTCDLCQRNKVARRLPYGLLEPHDVPPQRWHTVSMDFIGPIVKSTNGFDTILVVVDSASKRVHCIPCRQTDTAQDTAKLFELHVWRHHGLPTKIISDRDTRFTSDFWLELAKSLRIKLNHSTAYHAQTDGQTEQKNGWVTTCLRNFVDHYQTNWDTYLHVVEHGINDTVNSSTGYTPFYLDTGRNPTSLLDLSLNSYDKLSVRDMQAAYSVAKQKISDAQDKYAAEANKHRLEDPFKIGDLVLLSTKDFTPPNLHGQPTRKLGPRYTGPYAIKSKVGTSYKLALPKNWAVHPIFHPEKLRPYYWDHNGPHPLSSLPLAERTVEQVLAARVIKKNNRSHKQVLVKWQNHSPVYNVWLRLDAQLRSQISRSFPHLDTHTMLRDLPLVSSSLPQAPD